MTSLPAPAHPSDTKPAERFSRRLIAPLVLGAILNPVNSSMVAVALVPIGISLGAPPAQTAWLVSGLYLATATGQPVVGRLVDKFGPRRLYLVGTAFVFVAGLVGALAPNLGVLVVARVLLGFGTCAGYPATMYLIRSEAKRTGYDSPSGILTMLAVSSQTISVVGPALGGLLIGLGGWRMTFAVNIPLALACLVLGAWRLPRTPIVKGGGLDLTGMVLFAGMLTALMLFLMNPRLDLWWLVAIAIVMAGALVLRELRVAEPFIDLRLLSENRALLATYGRTFLTYIVVYAFFFGFPQWLEADRGLTPSEAGLLLLPAFLTAIIAAMVTSRRGGVRGKLLVGSGLQVAACGALLFVHASSPLWLLVVIAAALGVPQGLNNLANQNALYYQADPTRMGSSAGLLRTFMYLGAMTAGAATAFVFTPAIDTAGLHGLAVFLVPCGALLLLATLVDRPLGRIGRPDTAATEPGLDPSA